jgi:putative oxidoreductase
LATNVVLLLIRLVVGVAFIVSSRNKFRRLPKFAKANGLPVPVAGFLATAELAGALGLVSGVLMQLAALGLILIMTSTISLHIFRWHSPYWASAGGWEYDLMLLCLCAAVVITGGGQIALLR